MAVAEALGGSSSRPGGPSCCRRGARPRAAARGPRLRRANRHPGARGLPWSRWPPPWRSAARNSGTTEPWRSGQPRTSRSRSVAQAPQVDQRDAALGARRLGVRDRRRCACSSPSSRFGATGASPDCSCSRAGGGRDQPVHRSTRGPATRGRRATAYAGAHAVLLGRFWVQLFSGATLIVVGPLLALQLRGERAVRRRRAGARTGGGDGTRSALPAFGRGWARERPQVRSGRADDDRPGHDRGPRLLRRRADLRSVVRARARPGRGRWDRHRLDLRRPPEPGATPAAGLHRRGRRRLSCRSS